MSTTSKYIQLLPYVLVEYIYTDEVNPELMSYDFTKIVNGYTSQNQILNEDSAVDVTGSVRERSAVPISGIRYADLDKDDVPDYLSYDTTLVESTVSVANVPYDTVRFHLLAGYNFEDLDGVIFKIEALERSMKRNTFASIMFRKTSDFATFNPKPIFLGDRVYDKYVEIKVPCLKLINDTYYALEGNPSQSSTFVAQITSDGGGFLKANPIYISAAEVKATEVISTSSANYDIFIIGTPKEVSINQIDEFAALSAVIQLSEVGDYFEYYGSWNGAFLEDYITSMNTYPEYSYIVLHELQIFEQVGSQFKKTGNFQSIQEDNFDVPSEFRPILKNAATAVSYTIDYSMRLYNKVDNSQIIRLASVSGTDTKKWGKYLDKIDLLYAPESFKIYNKVVDGPIINAINTNGNNAANFYSTKYVPSFFEKSSITIGQENVFVEPDGSLKTSKSGTTTTLYGQGDVNIIISPFDNFYKFSIHKTENGHALPLNLNMNAQYFMVFIDNDGKKLRIENLSNSTIGDLSFGDVAFKVTGENSEKILNFTHKIFYIVSKTLDGVETSLYHGVFNKPEDTGKVKLANEKIKVSQSSLIEEKIKQIDVKHEELNQAIQSKAVQQAPNPQNAGKAEIPGIPNDNAVDKSSIISNIKPKATNVKVVSSANSDGKIIKSK